MLDPIMISLGSCTDAAARLQTTTIGFSVLFENFTE
jgi:hypothetical protein